MTFCTVCVCSVASPGTESATWSPTFTSLIGLLEPSAIRTPVEPTKLWVAQPVFCSSSRPAEGFDAGAASTGEGSAGTGTDQATPHRTRAHGGGGTGQGTAVLGRTTRHAIAHSGGD